MPNSYTEIRIGDRVRMRKPHPCGSDQWEVVRLGADIGIVCQGCTRKVLLPRSQFLRQVKALLQAGPLPATDSPPPGADAGAWGPGDSRTGGERSP